jgi:diguanylate cyclase (GGDEF)-like protein
MELAAPVAVVFAIWWYRPAAGKIWALFAAGLFLDFTGEVLWDLGWKSAGSVPDIAYFSGYVLVGISLLAFAHSAVKGRDVDDVLDLVIVSTGLLLLAGEFLVEPAVASSGELLGRITAVAYPAVGAAVLITLARLVMSPGRRVAALHLIVVALAIRFIADVTYSIQVLHSTYREGTVVDTGWIIASACFAAAALHPSMVAISAGAPRMLRHDGRVRLVAIAIAAVSIPMVIGFREASSPHPGLWVPLAIGALDLLVIVRVARLFQWRVRAESALEHRAAQQSAVASLGRRAVEGVEPDRLAVEAAAAHARLGGDDDREFADGLAGLLAAAAARREAEHQLAHQAMHDALTGLPNRVLFLDRVQSALTRSVRNPSPFALLFLDVDRFKVLNDSMGHGAGDQLLIDVASRLKSCARGGDTVARFGGDEFAILCENLGDERDAIAMAERVCEAMRQPFIVGSEPAVVTASIGVATSRPDSDADGLLRDADAAMYRAKDRGRDRFEMFDDAMRARAVDRMNVEQELRGAAMRGEFVVHYQPAVALSTGDVVG